MKNLETILIKGKKIRLKSLEKLMKIKILEIINYTHLLMPSLFSTIMMAKYLVEGERGRGAGAAFSRKIHLERGQRRAILEFWFPAVVLEFTFLTRGK